jgi:hypothetical protein
MNNTYVAFKSRPPYIKSYFSKSLIHLIGGYILILKIRTIRIKSTSNGRKR